MYYYLTVKRKRLKVLFCVFHTPKYCCKALIKKDMFKFLDAVSGHLKVSLMQKNALLKPTGHCLLLLELGLYSLPVSHAPPLS